jgi:serine phosphatase RsbU (regulator of sigma subunit)
MAQERGTIQRPSTSRVVSDPEPSAAAAERRRRDRIRSVAEISSAGSTLFALGARTAIGAAVGTLMVVGSAVPLSSVPTDHIRLGTVAFVFLAAVVIASWIGRLVAGLGTAAVATFLLAFEFASPSHAVTSVDQTAAVAIVAFLALALFISWLLARQDAAREQERVARRALGLMAAVSERLSETLDYETTLRVLADMLVPELADHAIVDVVDDRGSIKRLAVVGVEPEVADGLERYAPEPSGLGPVAVVIRDGHSRLFETMDSAIRQAAVNDEHRQIIERLGGLSAMVVPLRLWGAPPIGALTLVSSRRHFSRDDLALAEDLARRAAAAIQHARLYHEQATIAETLQRSLLPARSPAIEGVSVATLYRAVGRGNEVGGDFYDVWEIPDDGFGAAIGDVCGKGAEAAALTSLMRHTVRTASMHEPTPTRVLRVLNDAISRRLDVDRFCTVLYLHARPAAAGFRLRLAAGGHPLPYLVRRDGTVAQLGRPGLLLGVYPQIQVFDCEYDVLAGDSVVLFTDGVTEHRHAGEMFGEERLRAVLSWAAGSSASGLVEAIDGAVQAFFDHPLRDDMAILVLQFEQVAAAGFEASPLAGSERA